MKLVVFTGLLLSIPTLIHSKIIDVNACAECDSQSKKACMRALITQAWNNRPLEEKFSSALMSGYHFTWTEIEDDFTPEALENCIKNGVDVNKKDVFGYTPLMNLALWCGEYEHNPDDVRQKTEILLKNGADWKLRKGYDWEKNPSGQTAEDIAAQRAIDYSDDCYNQKSSACAIMAALLASIREADEQRRDRNDILRIIPEWLS